MRLAVLRGLCALAGALAFHALLAICAVRFGWLSPETDTLPELDLTSVDLSFSDSPDETASPVAIPPAPAVNKHTPPPPPESTVSPVPPPIDGHIHPIHPPPAEPRPTDLRPPLPEPPEAEREPEPSPQPQQSAPAPDVPAPSQARVAADKPPAPRRRIRPEYPQGARQRGEEGDVTLALDISADGTVDGVRIMSSCGFAELEQAAIQAVRRARFSPARRGTRAVPSSASLTLTFRLKD